MFRLSKHVNVLELIEFRAAWSPAWWSGRGELHYGATTELAESDWCAVIGDNGIGKSTLLHGLAGTCPFVKGTSFLHGEILTCGGLAQRFRLGLQFVPQFAGCEAQWHLSDVFQMACQNRPGIRFEAAHEDFVRWLTNERFIQKYSDAIPPRFARLLTALLSCPSVLLLDEVGDVYPGRRPDDIYSLVKHLAPRAGVFFVEHNQIIARKYANKVLVATTTVQQPDATIVYQFGNTWPEIASKGKDSTRSSAKKSELPLLLNEAPASEHMNLATRASSLSRKRLKKARLLAVEYWPFLISDKAVDKLSGGMQVILHAVMELLSQGKYDSTSPLLCHVAAQNRDKLDRIASICKP